jgi:hypothetical protein
VNFRVTIGQTRERIRTSRQPGDPDAACKRGNNRVFGRQWSYRQEKTKRLKNDRTHKAVRSLVGSAKVLSNSYPRRLMQRPVATSRLLPIERSKVRPHDVTRRVGVGFVVHEVANIPKDDILTLD